MHRSTWTPERLARIAVWLLLLAFSVALLALSPGNAVAHSNNPYKIVPNHSLNYMCLDAGSGSWGTVVVQKVCTGATSQQFDLVDVGSGYDQIKPKVASGVCLDISGGSYSAGAQVIVWGCHTGYNQQFSVPSCNTGCLGAFTVRHSGMCLGVKNASTAESTEVDQFTCNSQINQQFSIHNESVTRQKTGFPERWYYGTCYSGCSTSWMTLPFHRNVPAGLQSAWNSAIDNAKGYWNASTNTIYLSEDPPGVSYPNQDIIFNATQNGCWSIPELGRSDCVPNGVFGYTYWLRQDRYWACPSDRPPGAISCPNDRVPDTWWWALIGTNENEFVRTYSDVGYRALRRQATSGHEIGHGVYLRHDHSPGNPEVKDGQCGNSPLRQSMMDGDCLDLFVVTSIQPWDSCGINHAYYDPNWGYSGC